MIGFIVFILSLCTVAACMRTVVYNTNVMFVIRQKPNWWWIFLLTGCRVNIERDKHDGYSIVLQPRIRVGWIQLAGRYTSLESATVDFNILVADITEYIQGTHNVVVRTETIPPKKEEHDHCSY